MSGALDGLYQQLILEHAKRRDGEGLIDDFDAERFDRNPTCGDEIRMRIKVEDGIITGFGWEGDGCSISQASASVLAGIAPGLMRDDLETRIDAFRTLMRSRGTGEGDEELLEDAVAFAGVSKFPMRVKCAMLSWTALEGCLQQIDAGQTDAGQPDAQ
ncbi:Fe-S cluster assembly sulfur transfer protein SufU [Agrococcus casei]|uniref:Putative iron-sulfur cluster assembly scaffold protein for SUF system, SufE2 n=1 Tax=Agrococcus casei LMG 22410 TaxID=1255656 RepID=A0A1R4GEA3_9MICO|nr:SUF system NifU family Fe-S cluster assembly protein [Agrococcus casei]SJM66510.1 Putative iron-sulfur cluster assembly scaffold protein for SUF system, SufE2 [Agrococcus casei LMG 22410]